MGRTRNKSYAAMDPVALPEGIPEIGLDAGTKGVVDGVYADGTRLLVDLSSPEPPSALVVLAVEGDGALRIVGYTVLPT